MALLARLALVLFVSVAAADVRADVDLTGSWNITGFTGTFTVDVTQSGFMLAIGGYTGTIDLVTQSFMLESPPQPGGILIPGFPYGPSPPGMMNGVVAADGNSFDATLFNWIIKTTPPVDFEHFPWFLFDFPVHGVRRELATCGNGQIDAEEFCDDGDANGKNECCSSHCTVVDTDGDETCDAEDDCPLIYDYVQSCAVPLTLTSARASASGQLRTRGTLSERVGSFAEGTLAVGDSSRSFVFGSCQGNPRDFTRVRCASSDGLVRVHLWRRALRDEWRFRLIATGLPVVTEANGPISVEIVDRANQRKGRGQLDRCVVSGTHASCVP